MLGANPAKETDRKWGVFNLNSGTLFGSVITNIYAGTSTTVPTHNCQAGGAISTSIDPFFAKAVPSANEMIFLFDTVGFSDSTPAYSPGPMIASSVDGSVISPTYTDATGATFATRYTVLSSPSTRVAQIGVFLAKQNPLLTFTGLNIYKTKIGGEWWYIATQDLHPDTAGTVWQIVFAFPRSGFFAGIDRSITKSVILITCLSVAGLLGALAFSYLITLPLKTLGIRMGEVTKMKFSSLEGNVLSNRNLIGEIASLENTFQIMVQALMVDQKAENEDRQFQKSAAVLILRSHGCGDCPYLDVYGPTDVPKKNKLTVRIFIHGKSLTSGSASFPYHYGHPTAEQTHAIVVVIQYRLDVFGFLTHPAPKVSDGIQGTHGLREDIIVGFGEDVDGVSFFGESSGGDSVFMQLVSPETADLSSSGLHGLFEASPTVAPDQDDYPILTRAELVNGANFATFIIDGVLVPKQLEDFFAAGEFNKSPVLAGTKKAEAALQKTVITKDNCTGYIMASVPADQVAKTLVDLYPSSAYPAGSAPYSALVDMRTDQYCVGPTIKGLRLLKEQDVPMFQYRNRHRDVQCFAYFYVGEVAVLLFKVRA
ncbi:hypothetical protein HKX48_009456 [Thoreauomyces humboldtii]|nr:hypothetical protein HKX48_009456 [Thoreauomyces humboldtii]